jgi:hypothetical protein
LDITALVKLPIGLLYLHVEHHSYTSNKRL